MTSVAGTDIKARKDAHAVKRLLVQLSPIV
jgi:hypothetical protein